MTDGRLPQDGFIPIGKKVAAMVTLNQLACIQRALAKLARNRSGQDLIEYALLAATVAVAVAVILPTSLMPSVSSIYSRIVSSINVASTGGS